MEKLSADQVSDIQDWRNEAILFSKMFSHSLTEVDRIFPNRVQSGFGKEKWREKQHIILAMFIEEIRPLMEMCYAKHLHDLFDESKSANIIWPLDGVRIIEFVIRPQNSYYAALEKQIPQPDNPDGPNATGIELSISILRSISGDKVCYPARVAIQFDIWGDTERRAFISFHKNYRRSFEMLLGDLDLQLSTARYFENLSNDKNKSFLEQLDLYFANRQDPENCFSIGKTFNRNSALKNVSVVFKRLLILYYCCFGYCKKDKDLDRILRFIDDLA